MEQKNRRQSEHNTYWFPAPWLPSTFQGWGLLQKRDVKPKPCITGCRKRHKHTTRCNSVSNCWARGDQPSPVSALPLCLSRLSQKLVQAFWCSQGVLQQPGILHTVQHQYLLLTALINSVYIHSLKSLTHKEKPHKTQFPLPYPNLYWLQNCISWKLQTSHLAVTERDLQEFWKKPQRNLISWLSQLWELFFFSKYDF